VLLMSFLAFRGHHLTFVVLPPRVRWRSVGDASAPPGDSSLPTSPFSPVPVFPLLPLLAQSLTRVRSGNNRRGSRLEWVTTFPRRHCILSISGYSLLICLHFKVTSPFTCPSMLDVSPVRHVFTSAARPGEPFSHPPVPANPILLAPPSLPVSPDLQPSLLVGFSTAFPLCRHLPATEAAPSFIALEPDFFPFPACFTTPRFVFDPLTAKPLKNVPPTAGCSCGTCPVSPRPRVFFPLVGHPPVSGASFGPTLSGHHSVSRGVACSEFPWPTLHLSSLFGIFRLSLPRVRLTATSGTFSVLET